MEFARVEEFRAPGCAFNVVQYRRPRARSLLSLLPFVVGVWKRKKSVKFGGVNDEESPLHRAPSNPATRVAELCVVTGEVSFALRRA